MIGTFTLTAACAAPSDEDAREHPDSTPEMLSHLVCDVRNTRGLRFWERNGFVGIEPVRIAAEDVTYLRMVRA